MIELLVVIPLLSSVPQGVSSVESETKTPADDAIKYTSLLFVQVLQGRMGKCYLNRQD